jgi:AraC-like DNA-binding protein
MGNNIRIDQGLVHHRSGVVDTGYRFIMVVSVYEKTTARDSYSVRELVFNKVAHHDGRAVKLTGDDNLISVFDSAEQAFDCATEIHAEFSGESSIVFRIALCAGQPVTESNEFIEEAMRLARRLSLIAEDGQITMSFLFDELTESRSNANVRRITGAEEMFLTQCFAILDSEIANENFNIDLLVKSVGISRAQLYRRIQSLTGKAPNTFIRDVRLEKARTLLKRKAGNISEVAYEVGFSNPSYFAKCFAQRYGCLPSQFS